MSVNSLETVGICKRYPGTTALDDVSVRFEGGKVNALIGKNGAGKSTLVKILAGAAEPTSGKILVDGREVRLSSPGQAFEKGIATVYQELSLVPEMTVAENILLGRLPVRKLRGGFIVAWDAVFAKAEAILEEMGVSLDVRAKAGELPVGRQQIVEIAKGMSFNPSVVLFDEPTSALGRGESENLFKLIRKLAAKGAAIVYITHRLGELEKIADRVTVLRDGRYIDSIDIAEAGAEEIAELMFGKVVQKARPAEVKAGGEAVMEVRGLGQRGKFEKIDFTLYKGEILGIAGMLGSGRSEVLRAIFGADGFAEGEIIVGGEVVKVATPVKMKKLGLGFTPENRKEEGLVQILNMRENMCLAAMERIAAAGFTSRGREKVFAQKQVKDLDIKPVDIEQSVSSLSGGNQQKIVVGNWLNTSPGIILFDEPTRGIDVNAKQQIFQIMWNLSAEGISSIFVSSELEELLEVCHRILIMKAGRIVDEVWPEKISAEELLAAVL